MMLTAEQRYNQAVKKVAIQARQNFKKWKNGELPYLPAQDLRGALIAEIQRVINLKDASFNGK
jgi:hypothetical protein